MPERLVQVAVAAALLVPSVAISATDAELTEIRSLITDVKAQYEQRIRDLEARLARAEREAQAAAQRSEEAARAAEAGAGRAAAESRPMRAPASPAPASSAPSGFGALTSGAAFNPQISVFLDGNFYQDDIGGAGPTLVAEAFQPGLNQLHDHDHDHGHDQGDGITHAHGFAENGFNFREAEISFTAAVDPYFDAALFLSIDGDGNVDLEEGYFQTRSLPWGLRAKGGKFLSDFGYINRQHPHQWDFVDQNLPYLNLLGVHGLQDTGLQLTWLPKLPFYLLVGAEALQGDQELFGGSVSADERAELGLGDPNDGPRLWTGFLKLAPDLGPRHALQLGVSYAHNTTQQLVHEHVHLDHSEADDDDDHAHEHEHEESIDVHRAGLSGNATLWGLDLVYKYQGSGAHGHGDFKFQTEYLNSIKDLTVRSSAHPEQIGSTRRFTTDGLYAQATYGFLPRWSAGVRYDVLGLINEVSGGRDADFGSSDRWTADVSWSLSEFSKLRLQYAYNNILQEPAERERFNAFYLQFLVGMGSHGAHAF
jgi:hypothetical protein